MTALPHVRLVPSVLKRTPKESSGSWRERRISAAASMCSIAVAAADASTSVSTVSAIRVRTASAMSVATAVRSCSSWAPMSSVK